jgi:hypothetical protein
MLTIKCNKCGSESNNEHLFSNRVYSYIDGGNMLKPGIHLCDECQIALLAKTNAAVAEFLGVPFVRDWSKARLFL